MTPTRSLSATSPTPGGEQHVGDRDTGGTGTRHDDAQVGEPRPVTLAAFSSAAVTTTAVPCWSSWNTGMSRRSCSRRSISKHRGALMSSRLIPPYAGAMCATVSTISSTSVVSRQIGTQSMPPNSLNSSDLPSITGSAATGPMSPRPRTAVPSVTMRIEFAFHV